MNSENVKGAPAGVSLILGGQRSGKSAYAESLFAPETPAFYLATASAGDGEMAARIAAHRARRGRQWTSLEEPLDIARVLRNLETAPGSGPVLIDCLTVWLANVMAAGREPEVEAKALYEVLQNASEPVVVVSGEVGLGIIGQNALARRFADALGLLNQGVAAIAERVVLVAAGLPLILK